MLKLSLLTICLSICSFVSAQSEFDQISPKAEISLITCGTGEYIHTLFGHSAIRVHDPLTNLDIVFNYGTFDFNKPGFIIDFVNGRLDYFLSISRFDRFLALYIRENRDVHEHVLDLDQQQKQQIYQALRENYKEENRYYLYDFFFDNCSSRIRDIFELYLSDSLKLDLSYAETDRSFRDLLLPYLAKHEWTCLGINLLLGSPSDKIANPQQYMFLPDFLDLAFKNGKIYKNDSWVELSKKSRSLYEAKPIAISNTFISNIFGPSKIFWALFFIIAFVSVYGRFKQNRQIALDILVFSVAGFLGIMFLYFMYGTDHTVFPRNYNIFWACPLHIFTVFILLKWRSAKWINYYFAIIAASLFILIIFWNSWPQEFHPAVLPLCGILLIRSTFRFISK
ncbi:MAG: DUF4105 domain-containing protein [Chitinophagales bacterium]|nr:DUF4105 domain-containing protein [Chitinophagales bacterium]